MISRFQNGWNNEAISLIRVVLKEGESVLRDDCSQVSFIAGFWTGLISAEHVSRS